MHFICSPFGSAGDVHPFLGLGLALKERGHRVTFIVNGYFREAAEKYGLDVVELGTKEEFLEKANHPDLWNPMRSFRYMWTNLIQPSIPLQFEMFSNLYIPGETVGLANCLGFGALLAQKKLNMPVVTVNLQPAVIWSKYAPPTLPGGFGPQWMRRILTWIGERYFIDAIACPDLNRIRAEMGLSPVRHITRWWHSKWCVACLFPDWYCPPQPDWPSNLIQTDFPLWDDAHDEQLSSEVEAFLADGEPPIAFTPGSANMFGRPFFETAVEVCRKMNRRGILLTRFPEHLPSSLPEGIRHFSYVPFGNLLPRTAAVVHHGGVGSTAQGLAAGIPQMIMALAHDQFDNGARLQRLGVGDYVPQSKFRAPLVIQKLGHLLSSTTVRQNCRMLAEKLSRRDGLTRMAESLEQFAAERIR